MSSYCYDKAIIIKLPCCYCWLYKIGDTWVLYHLALTFNGPTWSSPGMLKVIIFDLFVQARISVQVRWVCGLLMSITMNYEAKQRFLDFEQRFRWKCCVMNPFRYLWFHRLVWYHTGQFNGRNQRLPQSDIKGIQNPIIKQPNLQFDQEIAFR